MIKFTMTRQCEVCGEWSSDSSGDWKFICVHTPEEYRDTLDQLAFKLDKTTLDYVAKKLNCELYEIIAEKENEKKTRNQTLVDESQ